MPEQEYQVQEVPNPKFKTIRELILYKMDRTMAIIGVIGLGAVALFQQSADNPLTMAAITGLVGYIGVKSVK